MKPTRKYFFSVEGETEKWYLDWLAHAINSENSAASKVMFVSRIERRPSEMVKAITINSETTVWHICDMESNEANHIAQFQAVLDDMKTAMSMGRKITYKLGYSNFTFELWMFLHKSPCFATFSHRKDYLTCLNQAFQEKFNSLRDFKKEANFARCLKKLKLTDVREAIKRAKVILKQRELDGDVLVKHGRFKYYEKNPSLSVWEIVEEILNSCDLK